MRRLLAVVVKELRQIRRDPLSLIMLIGLPAFLLVIFGFALNFDVRHVKLAVQDRDRSPASRELVASFTHSTYFDLVATAEPGTSLERLTERGVARAILVIPESYGRTLAERPARGGPAAARRRRLDHGHDRPRLRPRARGRDERRAGVRRLRRRRAPGCGRPSTSSHASSTTPSCAPPSSWCRA